MNKKLLVALSRLFKIEETVIEAELAKADGDDSILRPYTDKYNAYTAAELDTLLKNHLTATIEKWDNANHQIPKPLYDKIAFGHLEKKEKEFAAKHNIEKYDGIHDLLDKIVESKTGKGVDELAKGQIDILKNTVLEKENEIKKLREEHENEFVSIDHNTALKDVTKMFDYEAEAAEKQSKLFGHAFNGEFKVTRKDGKTIVLDKDGKPKVDKLGDPAKLSDVMSEFAKESGFKFKEEDPGGRGAASSTEDKNKKLKGVPFNDALKAAGLEPNTDASDAFFVEWTAQNPKQTQS